MESKLRIYDLYFLLHRPTKVRICIVSKLSGAVKWVGYIQDLPSRFALKKIKALDFWDTADLTTMEVYI